MTGPVGGLALPPLPASLDEVHAFMGQHSDDYERAAAPARDYYDADDMRAYATAAANEARAAVAELIEAAREYRGANPATHQQHERATAAARLDAALARCAGRYDTPSGHAIGCVDHPPGHAQACSCGAAP